MAVPNIVNVATINCKVVTGAFDTTTTTALLTCASDHVYKINTILISNIDGSSAADVTMTVRSDGSNDRHIAKTISVPADSTLALISKDIASSHLPVCILMVARFVKAGANELLIFIYERTFC